MIQSFTSQSHWQLVDTNSLRPWYRFYSRCRICRTSVTSWQTGSTLEGNRQRMPCYSRSIAIGRIEITWQSVHRESTTSRSTLLLLFSMVPWFRVNLSQRAMLRSFLPFSNHSAKGHWRFHLKGRIKIMMILESQAVLLSFSKKYHVLAVVNLRLT